MKNENSKIVIVGGGNAGISVASQILRANTKVQITIIDPNQKHYYQPAWTLVGAGVYDINDTVRDQGEFIPKDVTWIKEAVIGFVPDKNMVQCTNDQYIHYDILIVCPGIQLDWHKISGLKENLGKNQVSSNYDFNSAPYTWEMIKNFKGGTAIFTNPVSPIKCGGAPHKIMYLAVDYWRKKGILDKCQVHYLSGAGVIFGIKEYAATLNDVIKRGNIHTHFGVNVLEIDADQKTATFESKEIKEILTNDSFAGCYGLQIDPIASGGNKVTLKYDLIHAVPPQSAPDFIKRSPLADQNNPYGYVAVDKHTLQHTQYSNVFALGDCINAPCSKTGAAIRKQAPVVVKNMLSYLQGKELSAAYDGYSACPIPTQYGKLMLAEFDYSNTPKMTFPFDQSKPNWLMWILKTKVLPWLYWNRILTGKA